MNTSTKLRLGSIFFVACVFCFFTLSVSFFSISPAYAQQGSQRAPAQILVAEERPFVDPNVDIFDLVGNKLDSLGIKYDIADSFAVGDINGDGLDEILVAEDIQEDVRISDQSGKMFLSFGIGYGAVDRFAVGDVNGDGKAEILVADDSSDEVRIFDPLSSNPSDPITRFDAKYDLGDALAVGDVNGDGKAEILMAYIYEPQAKL